MAKFKSLLVKKSSQRVLGAGQSRSFLILWTDPEPVMFHPQRQPAAKVQHSLRPLRANQPLGPLQHRGRPRWRAAVEAPGPSLPEGLGRDRRGERPEVAAVEVSGLGAEPAGRLHRDRVVLVAGAGGPA